MVSPIDLGWSVVLGLFQVLKHLIAQVHRRSPGGPLREFATDSGCDRPRIWSTSRPVRYGPNSRARRDGGGLRVPVHREPGASFYPRRLCLGRSGPHGRVVVACCRRTHPTRHFRCRIGVRIGPNASSFYRSLLLPTNAPCSAPVWQLMRTSVQLVPLTDRVTIGRPVTDPFIITAQQGTY